jgi:hypothetical protein
LLLAHQARHHQAEAGEACLGGVSQLLPKRNQARPFHLHKAACHYSWSGGYSTFFHTHTHAHARRFTPGDTPGSKEGGEKEKKKQNTSSRSLPTHLLVCDKKKKQKGSGRGSLGNPITLHKQEHSEQERAVGWRTEEEEEEWQ